MTTQKIERIEDIRAGDKVDDWGIEAGLLRARAAYYERGDVDV